jgi:hypothetical protein
MPRTALRARILRRVLFAAALTAMVLAPRARADDYDPPGRVARLTYLRGPVSFQPAGDSDWVMAVVNRPLTTGDRVWTDSGAFAELSIGSATIRLGPSTGFSFLNLDDRVVQLELTEGTLGIRVRRLDRDEVFEVDTPNQAFSIHGPGQYRLEATEDGYATLVTVRRGEGEATGGGGETYPVYSGQTTRLTGTDVLRAEMFEASAPDEFDQWCWRRDRREDDSRSARYVSRDVVGYEDLDDYGSWRPSREYGYVWFPTRVAFGWAPYREGHWAWISPWGWTWVDDQPWGYAPFHYGRWVYVDARWGWVPGPIADRPVYAPALVAFIGGPGFGVSVSGGGTVGWFPLGPGEVYVPAFSVSPAYVSRVNVSNTTVSSTTVINVYNSQVRNEYRSTNVTYVNRTVPGGVTAVPQRAFVSAQPVARAAVPVNAQQASSAPVGARVAVAPTRESVLGAQASSAGRAARPPAAIAARPVVVKAPPPPPPVPFARQQEALAAHPGQPLGRQEVERLRPADRAQARPLVKQAPPARAAPPETRGPPSQPDGARPGQPPNARPLGAPPETPRDMRTGPPPSAQPGGEQRQGERRGAEPGPPAQAKPSAAPPETPRDMRTGPPPSAQPGREQRQGERRGAEPGPPAQAKPSAAPPETPRDMRTGPPPSAQPGGEPRQGERRGAEPGPPARAKPSAAPPPRPQETRTDRPPSARPERQAPPSADAPVRPGSKAEDSKKTKPQATPRQKEPQSRDERTRKEEENR